MEQRQLGNSGLFVSNLGLGTRTWGLDTDPADSAQILKVFLQHGGNLLEIEGTADYPHASQVIGELLNTGLPRNELRLCLRSIGSQTNQPGPGLDGLISSLDQTLENLGTDHVDLWLAEGPRVGVPLEETLTAFRLAIAQGKTRYVGLSNFSTWDGGAATASSNHRELVINAWAMELSLLKSRGLLGNHQNPMVPWQETGMGVIAGSVLAGGVLTGKYRHSTPPDSRATSPRFSDEIASKITPTSNRIIEATSRAADGLDKTSAQISLAWVRDLPGVTSALIGPRTVRQLEHLLEIDHWSLPTAVQRVLTEVSIEHGV